MNGIGRSDDVMYCRLVMELREKLVSLGNQHLTVPGASQQVAQARAWLLTDVGTPLSTFRGTIKHVPTTLLNEMAQTILDTIFPTFSNTVEFDQALGGGPLVVSKSRREVERVVVSETVVDA